MIDKILKDIKVLFKVQDKAMFLKQNIPYLAFFYAFMNGLLIFLFFLNFRKNILKSFV